MKRAPQVRVGHIERLFTLGGQNSRACFVDTRIFPLVVVGVDWWPPPAGLRDPSLLQKANDILKLRHLVGKLHLLVLDPRDSPSPTLRRL